MKCQHQILRIRWSDFVSNVDVQACKGLTTRRWAKSWQPVASVAYRVIHRPASVVSQCLLMPDWWLASGDQRPSAGSGSASEA